MQISAKDSSQLLVRLPCNSDCHQRSPFVLILSGKRNVTVVTKAPKKLTKTARPRQAANYHPRTAAPRAYSHLRLEPWTAGCQSASRWSAGSAAAGSAPGTQGAGPRCTPACRGTDSCDVSNVTGDVSSGSWGPDHIDCGSSFGLTRFYLSKRNAKH